LPDQKKLASAVPLPLRTADSTVLGYSLAVALGPHASRQSSPKVPGKVIMTHRHWQKYSKIQVH